MKQYPVYQTVHQGEGRVNWELIPSLEAFINPWSQGTIQKTRFMAQHDSHYLYARFEVSETSLNVERLRDHKLEVVNSDRVELFFTANLDLKNYYCLELDPYGRVLDYAASHYRNFDYDWRWPPNQLEVNSRLTGGGYQIEVSIGEASLNALDLIHDNGIYMGIFRADCKGGGQKGKGPKIFDWISWVDPGTREPDFHVPSAFGRLQFLDAMPAQR